jgi:hypothetical protein
LHFHHLDKVKKVDGVTRLVNRHTLRTVGDINDMIVSEMEKCVVLCSNCHRIEHFDTERFCRYRKQIEEKAANLVDKPKVDAERVVALAKNKGLNKQQIAGLTGYSAMRVYEILRANGLGASRKHIDTQNVLQKWNEGKCIPEIIRETGHCRRSVRKVLIQAGHSIP